MYIYIYTVHAVILTCIVSYCSIVMFVYCVVLPAGAVGAGPRPNYGRLSDGASADLHPQLISKPAHVYLYIC